MRNVAVGLMVGWKDGGRDEVVWRAVGGAAFHGGCLLMAGSVLWQSGGVMPKKSKHRKLPASEALSVPHDAPVVSFSLRSSSLAPWMALACVVLCAGLYGWTADFQMVFDDFFYLKNNPYFLRFPEAVRSGGFVDFAGAPAREGLDPDLTANMLLRPFAYATFLMNHALYGFEPRWFRLVNIVIHAANGWLIFVLLTRLGRSLEGRGLMSATSSCFIAVSTALVFLAHPLAVESVTYIAQRFTSMGTLFVLLCLAMHFKALDAGGSKTWWRAGAVLAALLGMLTKEDTVTVPLLALGLDWLVMGSQLRVALRRSLPLLLLLPVVPVVVMAVSSAQNGGQWGFLQALNLANLRAVPWGHQEYAFTQCTVLVEYLRLIVWPAGQNVRPDWPVYDSLLAGPVLRALALLLGMLGLAWWLGRRQWMGGQGRLVFAFVLWFFTTVLVSSGPVPLPDMMAEHRCYLPSIGVMVALVCVVDRLRQIPGVVPGFVVTGTVMLMFSSATCLRNETWRTELSLWEDTVAKSPGQFLAWNDLGLARWEAGDEEGALDALRKSLEIAPHYADARCNLAGVLCRLQRWQECLAVIGKVRESDLQCRRNADFLYNRAIALAGLGRLDESAKDLERVVSYRPDFYLAVRLLGVLHHKQAHLRRARLYLSQAEALQPGDPVVTSLLASLDGDPARP